MTWQPWFVSQDWGGGYSIRYKDAAGEWIVGFFTRREEIDGIVELVNAQAADAPPSSPKIAEILDLQLRAARNGQGSFDLLRDDDAQRPLGSFNRPDHVERVRRAFAWGRERAARGGSGGPRLS